MIIGKSIARFWARCTGPGDGLFVGASFKRADGTPFFKPNTVYELVEDSLDGEVKLREVGPSHIRGCEEREITEDEQWCHTQYLEYNHIALEYAAIASNNPYVFLSATELRLHLVAKQNQTFHNDYNL